MLAIRVVHGVQTKFLPPARKRRSNEKKPSLTETRRHRIEKVEGGQTRREGEGVLLLTFLSLRVDELASWHAFIMEPNFMLTNTSYWLLSNTDFFH